MANPSFYFGESIAGAENAKEDARRFFYQTQAANRNYDLQRQSMINNEALQRAQLERQDLARALQQRQIAIANSQRAAQQAAENRFNQQQLAQQLGIANQKAKTTTGNVFARIAAENKRQQDALNLRRDLANRTAGGRDASAYFNRVLKDQQIRDVPEMETALRGRGYSRDQELEAMRALAGRQRQALDYANRAKAAAIKYDAILQANIKRALPGNENMEAQRVLSEFVTRQDLDLIDYDPTTRRITPKSGIAAKYPTDALTYLLGRYGETQEPDAPSPATYVQSNLDDPDGLFDPLPGEEDEEE